MELDSVFLNVGRISFHFCRFELEEKPPFFQMWGREGEEKVRGVGVGGWYYPPDWMLADLQDGNECSTVLWHSHSDLDLHREAVAPPLVPSLTNGGNWVLCTGQPKMVCYFYQSLLNPRAAPWRPVAAEFNPSTDVMENIWPRASVQGRCRPLLTLQTREVEPTPW